MTELFIDALISTVSQSYSFNISPVLFSWFNPFLVYSTFYARSSVFCSSVQILFGFVIYFILFVCLFIYVYVYVCIYLFIYNLFIRIRLCCFLFWNLFFIFLNATGHRAVILLCYGMTCIDWRLETRTGRTCRICCEHASTIEVPSVNFRRFYDPDSAPPLRLYVPSVGLWLM